MSELNKDGLIPGQQVDFETLQRVNRQRKEVKQDAEQSADKEQTSAKPKRARASKNANG